MAEMLTRDEVLERAAKYAEMAKAMITPQHRLCIGCLTLYGNGDRSICFCDYESQDFLREGD